MKGKQEMKVHYTIPELVERFGTRLQKEAFSKSKTGNLNKRTIESIVKTLRQHYQSVIVEGKGSKRIFICEGLYDVVQERKTSYSNCGKHNELPYKEALAMLVLQYIINAKPDYPMSLNQWLIKSGAVDIKIVDAKRKAETKSKNFKELVESNVLNSKQFGMLEHYVNYELAYLKNGIKSAFKELERAGIIYHTIGRMACYNKIQIQYSNCGDPVIIAGAIQYTESKEYKLLDEKVIFEIGKIEKELQEKFNISPQTIYVQPNKTEVKEYNRELKGALMKLGGIEYTFEAHGAYIKTWDEPIIDFLKRAYTKEFRAIYQKYSLLKAQSRQESFNEKSHTSTSETVCLLKELEIYVNAWERLQEYYNIKTNDETDTEELETKGKHISTFNNKFEILD
jgi:hypothetical protein